MFFTEIPGEQVKKKIMRRSEKEIVASEQIEEIIRNAKLCRLALCQDDWPYIVPVCFGYEDGVIYIHSARAGKKIDILRSNARVCFEFDIDVEIQPGISNCDWGVRYRSVIGFGYAEFVEDEREKARALNILIQHYEGTPTAYPEKMLRKTEIIRIIIERMTGKYSN